MSTVKSFAYRAFKERSSYNKSIFPQCQGYYSCYWSCHAMPATSATTQRSFSSLRCVKLYLRTTVIEARIRGLVCLASISLCNWDTYSWRPLHTHTLQASCEQEHEAYLHIICKIGHGRQAWLWWPTKIHRLCHLQAVPLDSKHTEVFHQIGQIRWVYNSLRCQDLQIWQILCPWQQRRQNQLLYHLHMRAE